MSRRRGRPRLGGWFITVNLVMSSLTTAIAAAAFWPIYRSVELIVLVIATMAVGSIIAILGAVLRWSTLRVTVASLIAFLVLGVPLAVPGLALYGIFPTLEGLWALVSGVALGWKRLLTISLPVGDYEALLVPVFLLVLVTTVVGLTIAIRSRVGDLAVIAPIVLFVTGILFGPDFAAWPQALSLGLMIGILLWLIWRRWYRRREAIRLLTTQAVDARGTPIETPTGGGFVGFRSILSGALILAIACGGAIAIADAAPPMNERVVLRNGIEQPFDPRDYVSPLSAYRSYWRSPAKDSVLFTVNGLPTGERVRVATLDSYDGIVYSVGSDLVTSSSGSFTRVPFTFDQSAVRGEPVRISVSIIDYSLVWVPTIGAFTSISFAGSGAEAARNLFYYNDTSRTAAVVGGLSDGDSYALDAVMPNQPGEDELATLDPGSATVPVPRVLPVQLGVALDAYVADVEGPGARLVAMLSGLKADGYISHGVGDDEPRSRSGHAADRIDELFTASRMIGDAEQYAVAAALMAQQLGFPARVVFGFEPHGAAEGGIVPVRGSDASAWIEVNTAQYGWVAIDSTPPVREIPEEIPRDPAQVARPITVVPPPVTESEPVDPQSSPDSVQDEPRALDPVLLVILAVLQVLGWIALVCAIALAPFLVIIGAKLRRRRLRRKAPSAVDRITGGWHEFEDAVVDHGYLPPSSATRSEMAATFGGMQSRILASVADRAVFAPMEPDEAEVESVWRAVADLRATMAMGRSRWERLRAAVSLKSLGGYSVTRFLKRK